MAISNNIGTKSRASLPVEKIIDASGGNNSLREVLQALTKAQQTTAAATNQTTKNAPAQCYSQVSFLSPSYIVEITLPGAVQPTSSLQAAQVAKTQTANTNVTAIYHQIQAATSPSFSAASNVTLYGGQTGSTQTYWNIGDLSAGRWYFRVRSSYDGINWNQWKNSNYGQNANGSAESVTVEDVTSGVSAVFQLPGAQTVAFVAALTQNGGTFSLPENLFTGSMQAIAAPNGYGETGNDAHGWTCEVGTAVTLPPTPTTDYAPLVTMTYMDGAHNTWYGGANIFAFAWNALGTNQSVVNVTGGSWAVFTLGGGAQLAIGSGLTASGGGAIPLPPGFTAANTIATASAASGFSTNNQAMGVTCTVDANLNVVAQYNDGQGDVWPATATWFAVAVSPGLDFVAVAGGRFLVLNTPGGSKVAIGMGVTASGSAFTLPAGFNFTNSLAFAAPGSNNQTGHPMHGVAVCGADNGNCVLSYLDGQGDSWNGNVNWTCFCWQ